MSPGLSNQEVMRVVNRYIGVAGGYLGDFSYRTHADFYPEYCGLDYHPDGLEGTTRERFIEILQSAPPNHQALIVRGVLERFPVGAEGAPKTRTLELVDELRGIAARLEGAAPVSAPDLPAATAAVERAIKDAEILLRTQGPVSAVDRVHTSLHGYLETVALEAGLDVPEDSSVTGLFGLLRREHPRLQAAGGQAEHITRLLKSIAALLDPLQPVRNQGSVAHPNEELLGEAEAMLVVNTVRTVLRYFVDKLA